MFSSNVLDSLSIQLAVLDANGTVIAMNQAWIEMSLSRQSSPLVRIDIGDHILDVFRRAYTDAPADALWAVAQGRTAVFNFEYQWGQNWYLLRGVPLKSAGGGVVLTHIDISEIKQAEAQQLALRLTQERINTLADFIQNFSHDFRIPLSTIKTTLYLMGKEGRASDYRLQLLDEQVNHLEKLVEGFRLMARLDSQSRANKMPLDMRAIIQRVADGMHSLADPKHLRITLKLEPNLNAKGDEHDLEIAVRNLLENAILYTPDGGEVTIEGYYREDYLIIEVRDTGIGILAVDLPHIFERFYRVDKARSLPGHPGLGLPIARKIIELHGGELQAESMTRRGSTFRILLPVQ
jgi:signal transduction histidine kinase